MISLWDHLQSARPSIEGTFHAREATVCLSALSGGSLLGGQLDALRGKSLLLSTRDQLATALALLELDGVARRMVLCTPDLSVDLLSEIAHTAEADGVICDLHGDTPAGVHRYPLTPSIDSASGERRSTERTEWVLLTSGTTRSPKLVSHTLDSLAGFLPTQPPNSRCVWSTFYDIRRYGGLQIYLRAVLSGTALVLSSPGESIDEFFGRGAAAGVTHQTGTPSHWRRALMSGDTARLSPDYVRMSGEVADQAIIDALQTAYPNARVAHAFASTEAGVAFEVTDGLAGFPASLLGERNGVSLTVQDDTLRIRSNRTATRYLGDAPALRAPDDSVDTGDLVEREGDRYFFRGRRGGIINVGGLKVYPEEVEAVLNGDPRVRMSRVTARRSPITGSLVVAEVVLADATLDLQDAGVTGALKEELLAMCRGTLPAHKIPALLRFVPGLNVTAAGKLQRHA